VLPALYALVEGARERRAQRKAAGLPSQNWIRSLLRRVFRRNRARQQS
jgi:hypothetical protein